jgi:hypothetical protein
MVDAVATTLGVAGDQGVLPGASAVHPGQLAGHAQAGLVEPGHLGVGDPLFDLGEEPVEPVGAAPGHGRHRGLADRGAEQLGQRLGGALLGQELPHVEVEHDRGDPRPVLHRRRHTLRRGGAGGGPAGAAADDELVLDDVHGHRRQIEHLPTLHPHLGRAGQARPTAGARVGLVPAPLVRVVDQRQRRPRMTGLPARLPARPAAQRLRGRLGERRVRRRRARRVGRVLPQLPPQLRNFSLELLDPLTLPYDELGELLIRRTTVSRHPAMIATFARRSTRHAGDLTSHETGRYTRETGVVTPLD